MRFANVVWSAYTNRITVFFGAHQSFFDAVICPIPITIMMITRHSLGQCHSSGKTRRCGGEDDAIDRNHYQLNVVAAAAAVAVSVDPGVFSNCIACFYSRISRRIKGASSFVLRYSLVPHQNHGRGLKTGWIQQDQDRERERGGNAPETHYEAKAVGADFKA